jgi:hypothetical protein
VCAGWTLTAAAQSGGPVTLKAPADSEITVEGCLAERKTAGAANSTTEHALYNPDNYTLTKASTVATPVAANGSTPVANQTKNAGPGEYRLDGSESMLAPHVGHRVRITGSLEKPASGGNSTASMVKVDSVLLLESSCS